LVEPLHGSSAKLIPLLLLMEPLRGSFANVIVLL
jgi:hypothetical protein